ncbi:DUF2946 family protein [Collimonas pratensis]|uniref:DUF2946 domain-containing protein n=1 Tax=Collimonas pratensis TaxID=279113 RepID=A0ABN4MH89_9BURK|nr:DUF2946 family protein [Collimonas pratensis]AMP16622.1 hypothetical protein CPter291_4396 [Collimonas pratensis]
MFRLPRPLRQLAICLAMFAALLPSVVQLLPAAHGQPLGLGELCSVAGHLQAPASGNHDAPDQDHQGHCLLCFLHAADLGLPPGVSQWQLPASEGIDLPQAASTLHASIVRLHPQSRGPPALS